MRQVEADDEVVSWFRLNEGTDAETALSSLIRQYLAGELGYRQAGEQVGRNPRLRRVRLTETWSVVMLFADQFNVLKLLRVEVHQPMSM